MKQKNEPAKPPLGGIAVGGKKSRAPGNPSASARLALIVAVYLCAFLLLDFITRQFEVLPGIVSWYPPAGLTYTLLLVFGAGFAPAVTIALFISSIFIYRMPQPPYLLFLWAFIISLIYGLAAAFLRKIIRFDWQLRKLRDVTWFVCTTVLVSALLAVLSVSSSALSSAIPRSEVFGAIFHWWIGETVGVLSVTPFLLFHVMPWLKRFAEGQPVRLTVHRSFGRPTLSAIGQVSSIILILYWVFGTPVLDEFHPLFLIALPLIWIAMTRGLKGISAAILALNSGVVLALWLFRFDLTRLGELELLMIVNCIVGLLMGAVVTERKQAEQTLQKSEDHLRLVTDNMQDLVVRTDLEGIILYASPSNKTVLGYAPEYLLGKSIYDFMYPEDIKRVREFTLASLQAQTPGMQELRYIHADGHYVWLESTGAIIFDASGSSTGAVFSSREITERKRTEEELIKSEGKFRAIFDNANTGMFIVDLQTQKFFMCNSTCAKMLGYAKEEFLNLDIAEIHPGEDMPFINEQIGKFSRGEEGIRSDIKFKRKNGSIFASDLSPALLTIADKEYLLISFIDITERKRMEAERQTLLEIMQGVAVIDSLTDLLELIRKSLTKVIYAENFFVVFKNKNTGLFEEVFAVDKYDPAMPPSKLEKSVTSYVFRTGEPLLLTQAKFEALVRRGEAELVGTKPAIWMGAPLRTPTETIGVMVVQNYDDPNCYSEHDKDFLTSISAQVALAIEHKRDEEALQESENRLHTIVEGTQALLMSMDSNGHFTYANDATAMAVGYASSAELIGKSYLHFIHPDDRQQVLDTFINQATTRQRSKLQEFRITDTQGKVKWFSFLSNLAINNGQVIGITGVAQNITERKNADEAIRESEKRYQNLAMTSPVGIFRTNQNGDTIYINPMYCQISGLSIDEALGDGWNSAVHPEDKETLIKGWQESIRLHQASLSEYRFVHPDGTITWVLGQAVPEMNSENQVEGYIGTITDITERKQREEEIRSRNEELTTLYKLSRLLADANDLENVIELVNRHAVESVHTTFACIALLEEDELVPRAVYPVRIMEHDLILGDRQPIIALPVSQGVLDKNEPVILQTGSPEVGSLERLILLLDFAQSVCLVPLWVGGASQGLGTALGLLILGEARQEKREPFTPEKMRLARSIGDQAASAIRRLLSREQAGRRLQQLASLSEIDRTIASNFDLRVSLQMILTHVSEQLEVDAADVLVLNKHLQILEFTAGRGFRSPAVEGTRQRLGEGQAGRALLERQLVQIPDVAASGAVFAHPELLEAEGVAAYFAVPLITKGQVKGVLEICHRTPLEPNKEWLDFLRTLAGQAAIAIDVVQLVENLQRSTDELELAYDATIEGWSHALDLRDKETEGHTQRVTEMTVKLARSFGLSEAELVQVRWGALLHDIGKMGVPDNILLKPGPLTDEEWVLMKKHPTFAYEMLSPIRYLRLALDIPYCHHEKWDGSGYPRGLKGEQIPLVARIFAVVDVWDALISDRPYRLAWPEEKARQLIKTGAGTHFDPQVVKEFLSEYG